MVKKLPAVFVFLLYCTQLLAQDSATLSVTVGTKIITLSDVVVNNKLNVPSFINRIKNDTSFYKAFRNLHVLGFSAINDIRMIGKEGVSLASCFSKTRQITENKCRRMEVLEEQTTGDYYDDKHQYNYYTAQLYASLFFTIGTICGESNVVAGNGFSVEGKTGLQKHKEQLKMLFFNPGTKIRGLPFMSGKTAIYDDDMSDVYDMSIDMDDYNKTSCYLLTQKVKPGMEGRAVVDEMTTWFNDKTFEVIARKYSLSYDAGVYDFNVQMEVQLTHSGELLVPSMIRYNGNWKAIFKKRERGVFTATLFDFKAAGSDKQ